MGEIETGEVVLRLDDGTAARLRFLAPEDGDRVLAGLGGGAPLRVRVRPGDGGDTAGHAADGALVVDLEIEGDTAGHAISLHFPTVDEARRFQQQLLAAGVIAGALAVGVVAANPAGFQVPDIGVPQAPAAVGEPRAVDSDVGLMDFAPAVPEERAMPGVLRRDAPPAERSMPGVLRRDAAPAERSMPGVLRRDGAAATDAGSAERPLPGVLRRDAPPPAEDDDPRPGSRFRGE